MIAGDGARANGWKVPGGRVQGEVCYRECFMANAFNRLIRLTEGAKETEPSPRRIRVCFCQHRQAKLSPPAPLPNSEHRAERSFRKWEHNTPWAWAGLGSEPSFPIDGRRS